ncbi:MAG TPA: hypothetical protein VN026_09540 [Bacteroidia bacterium]|jgi:hypothetical protein|nr:hypothetical protein [Bacteroidia bacterium]
MRLKAFFVLFALTFFCNRFSFSQNVTYSLIVVHYDPASKGEFKQLVYSYHFLNGHYQGREELISFLGRIKDAKGEKDYIRTDIGTNQLYKNRYLITGIGNIIDLKEKKILFDQKANLVRCSNDSAIYYTNDAFKGKFYSVYNFTTNKYAQVKSLTFKAVPGQDIEFDRSVQPFKLNFYPVDKPKIVLSTDAGYGQTTTDLNRANVAVWWLDKNNFVYPYFNKDNTEITFMKVSIGSKASVAIGKGSIKQQNDAGTFTPISKTQAQYNFGDKKFMVDVEKKSVTEMTYTNPENGFSVECKDNPYGHIIKYNGKEVSKQHFQLKNLKTEQNIAAIVKELIVGTESYQQGLSVFNQSNQAWENVDAEEVVALIGWMKD